MPVCATLGTLVRATTFAAAQAEVLRRAQAGIGGAAYFCNVHMLIEQYRLPQLRRALRRAELVFADGRPVAMAQRLFGHRQAEQVAGPEMTHRLMPLCQARNLSIFLYGGSPEMLTRLQQVLRQRWPSLCVAGAISPPFRPLHAIDPVAERADVEAINASGAHICLVGLGCPKQELWIERHRATVKPVLLGVGAAFAMLAGVTPRAPAWMVRCYVEWLYRLAKEPKRLWGRYSQSNPLFLNLLLRELWSR